MQVIIGATTQNRMKEATERPMANPTFTACLKREGKVHTSQGRSKHFESGPARGVAKLLPPLNVIFYHVISEFWWVYARSPKSQAASGVQEGVAARIARGYTV